jgi:MOSC domain-containing protein YiiM
MQLISVNQLYVREQNNPELLHRAAQLEALLASWRDYFQEQIHRQDAR